MKILIVDDERHVREAIKLLIDWEKFQISSISEAADGQQAINLLEAYPFDIVLTDMLMPAVNGVQLLEWIHKFKPHCKTIVISGYDDFTYVRHTIKFGGQDYILKPIDEQQLNEALEKAISARLRELKQQSQSFEHNKKLNIMKPHYWNKVFSTIIDNGVVTQAIEQDIIQEFSLQEPIKKAIVAILPLATVSYSTLKKFNFNNELLSFSLANIANEYLLAEQLGFAFANWNKEQDVMIIIWKNTDNVVELLSKINSGIEKTFQHQCDFGLGTLEIFPSSIKKSLNHSIEAIKHYNTIETKSRIHLFTSNNLLTEPSLKFEKYQEHIRLALLSGKQNVIELHVNEWFKQLEKINYISLHQLELWLQAIALFEAKCFELEPTAKPDLSVHLKLSHFTIPFNSNGKPDIEEWKKILISTLSLYANVLSQTTKLISISDEIADYIRQNYNQDVSLQTIADCFLLSREYISRKFKQDMNENISDYIAKIRLSHAKQLLNNPNLKLVQIAELVGFTDEKYFSKVFKKIEGVSPNQYRKDQFKIPK